MPDLLPEPLLTEAEVARYLNINVRTVQNWRLRGGGPTFIKINNRAVRYRPGDIKAYVDAQERASTSDQS